MIPCSVASRSLTLTRAAAAFPFEMPIPAMTDIPCGSAKICPSAFKCEPTTPPSES